MDSSVTGDSDYAFSSPALLHLGRPVEDNAARSEWQGKEYACSQGERALTTHIMVESHNGSEHVPDFNVEMGVDMEVW